MRDGLKLWVLMAAIGACGDDGVGSESTTDGTGSTGISGPTTTAPSTSTTDETSTGTAEGSGSTGGSTDIGSESGSNGTGSGSEDGSGTGSGSGSDSGSEGETASVCTPVDFTPVLGEAFSGWGFCEGVQTNGTLDDAMAVGDHNEAFCETLAMCIDPDPACPPAPDVDLDGSRVVYVQGQVSGCSAAAMVSEVLDCGDQVEVHWVVAGVGPCATIVNGWDAALIPDGAEVVFIQD